MHNKTLLPSLADFIGFGAFIFCVVGGCNSLMEDDQIPITSSEDTQVMVPERNLLLFADLDDYYITPPDPDTKSSESLTPLSSLLDESGTTSLDFEGTHFVQTPFLSNREQVLFSRSSILPNEGDPVSPDSLLYLKKFYIRETTPDGILSSYVVTMMTGKQYCDVFGYENINFLEKPNYTGYIIFSGTDGDVDCVYFYENGLILDSYLLNLHYSYSFLLQELTGSTSARCSLFLFECRVHYILHRHRCAHADALPFNSFVTEGYE